MLSREHAISVRGIPTWVAAPRLLGERLPWRVERGLWVAAGPAPEVADVQARLRGIGFGHPLEVVVEPGLRRADVRRARLEDARRRRDTTPGFLRGGVELDDEARISLTPEVLAMDLARRVGPRSVIDACCGAGGNAIAFARAGATVTAIELDPARARMAEHNARVYGVAPRVVVGDARALLPTLEADVVFVDPPWGADWNRARTGLDDLPLLRELLPGLARFASAIVKVPPSFDPAVLPDFVPRAVFGEAPGDRQRVKFVLLER
jgi:SAM-dependent methyltransferase